MGSGKIDWGRKIMSLTWPLIRLIVERKLKRTRPLAFFMKVRLLVGTKKGAFILTSDGKRENWDISGPHFAGWEMYHLKGSPVDQNRIYASQTSGWFGQII